VGNIHVDDGAKSQPQIFVHMPTPSAFRELSTISSSKE
jgi:hypothetical protein